MERKNTNIKRISYIFLILAFLYNFSFFNSYIYANQQIENNIESEVNNSNNNNNNNMNLELFCNNGIAMDFETGNVLYNNNANKKIYPASTTKILTCIIAIEKLSLDDTYVISNNVIQNTPYDSSVMGFKAGELYTIEELLYGLMLPSGNDAALAIAEAVSGSTHNFVLLMNRKLKELGCNNTNFTNPHGYHDDNHYSTAYDMAIIFKYCLKNETFRKIIGTNEITVKAANSDKELKLKNSNRMQNPNYSNYYYEYIKGGKTGYTLEARGTFIGYATKDDKTIIAAAFDGSQNINGLQGRFLDTAKLFDYSFSNYSRKMILNSNDYTFKIYDEKNSKSYIIKLENDVFGIFNKVPNIEYNININHDEIDKILSENLSDNSYVNKQVGTIEFKYSFNDNKINSTSNIINTKNLILVEISNYIPNKILNKIAFSIIEIILLLIIIIFILTRIKPKKRKKSIKTNKNYYFK